MYVKVTKSGPRKYVQLVEAYRDENGRPKQRTIASLGRLEQLGDNILSANKSAPTYLLADCTH